MAVCVFLDLFPAGHLVGVKGDVHGHNHTQNMRSRASATAQDCATVGCMDYITLAQAASEYDIPKRTLQAAAARGAIHGTHKLPGETGAFLVRRRDVQQWLDERKGE